MITDEVKEILLERLDFILQNLSLISYVDEISNIRKMLIDSITVEESLTITNRIKAKFQKDANIEIDNNRGNGLVVAGTGSGKSKIAVDRVKVVVQVEIEKEYPNFTKHFPRILLVVPTERLRDEGWKSEFDKWSYNRNINCNYWQYIIPVCYASLDNIAEEDYDLVILDECHNITEAKSIFFRSNTIKNVIALTATEPKGKKLEFLGKIGCNKVYDLSLENSIKLGIVAPFDITIITIDLDNKSKYIKAGNKLKSFKVTEKEQYDYYTRKENEGELDERMRRNRMHFIYGLKSKTDIAIKLLEHIVPKKKRVLIFCGGKDQANKVCEHRFYSKPTFRKTDDPIKKMIIQSQLDEYHGDKDLKMFLAGDIDRMACVNALNEGHNLGIDLDIAFMIQMNGQIKDFKQRLGRILRWRPGYTGKIIVLVAKNTVDQIWVNKVLRELNINKMQVVDIEEIRLRKEIINF